MTASAHAELYMAPLDRAAWQVEKSPISCRLHQAVPKYGDVIFETPAGKPQFFYVEVEAQRLLQALRDGMVPELARPGLENAAPEPVRLGLSPVHFQRAYAQYEECIAQLLPHSFEEMANTPIPFERDRVDLGKAARGKIDLLLRYVRAERRAPRIHIDVLSDDSFRRVENLELSKLRAQTVNDYLVSKGIGTDAISVRYRSMRGGGDLSRRSLTIRLQRAEVTAEQGPRRPKSADAG